MSRQSLQRAYALWAPIYDSAVRSFSAPLRQCSLGNIPQGPCRVLVDGIGTGLDIPYLPAHCEAIGQDAAGSLRNMAEAALPQGGREAAHRRIVYGRPERIGALQALAAQWKTVATARRKAGMGTTKLSPVSLTHSKVPCMLPTGVDRTDPLV